MLMICSDDIITCPLILALPTLIVINVHKDALQDFVRVYANGYLLRRLAVGGRVIGWVRWMLYTVSAYQGLTSI